MTTTIRDTDAARRLTIEADNPKSPQSVFIMGPKGLTMEFDRADFMRAVARELGLIDPLEVILDMPSATPGRFELPEGCNNCPMAPIVLERLGLTVQ